ncbi:MAG: LysM peptidoglycan-binding domain-containing protein [Amnibacterium sp.]
MITVENDWIEYAPVAARRTTVRGGAVCAQRIPVARAVPAAPGAGRVVVAHRAGSAPRRRLRLTRRGRVVLVVLPAVLALSSAFVVTSTPFAQAEPAVQRTVVVGTGDSLWSLAERLAPSSDPRDVVAELERANGLRGAAVQAGARLVVPADLAR